MTKLEKAIARYRKALDRREAILHSIDETYARACDRAAAASIALGELDAEVRTATYQVWCAERDRG